MTPISSKWKAQGRQTDRQTDGRDAMLDAASYKEGRFLHYVL